MLNNPGNLTLRKMIQYARAMGKKVAIIAYDDNDPQNMKGLVNAQVFERCWERAGKPVDFFSFEEPASVRVYSISAKAPPIPTAPNAAGGNTSDQLFGTSSTGKSDADRLMTNR